MQQPEPATAVIDTNVVLDWLVFGNADAAEVAGFITSGRLRWLSTNPMRDELEHVLTRDTLQRWKPQADRVLRTWDEWSQAVPVPPPIGPHGVHCTDPDDQKFIDLAIGMRSSWLFTRDRSLLRLARRARQLGVEVLTPGAWLSATHPPSVTTAEDKKGGHSRPETVVADRYSCGVSPTGSAGTAAN